MTNYIISFSRAGPPGSWPLLHIANIPSTGDPKKTLCGKKITSSWDFDSEYSIDCVECKTCKKAMRAKQREKTLTSRTKKQAELDELVDIFTESMYSTESTRDILAEAFDAGFLVGLGPRAWPRGLARDDLNACKEKIIQAAIDEINAQSPARDI